MTCLIASAWGKYAIIAADTAITRGGEKSSDNLAVTPRMPYMGKGYQVNDSLLKIARTGALISAYASNDCRSAWGYQDFVHQHVREGKSVLDALALLRVSCGPFAPDNTTVMYFGTSDETGASMYEVTFSGDLRIVDLPNGTISVAGGLADEHRAALALIFKDLGQRHAGPESFSAALAGVLFGVSIQEGLQKKGVGGVFTVAWSADGNASWMPDQMILLSHRDYTEGMLQIAVRDDALYAAQGGVAVVSANSATIGNRIPDIHEYFQRWASEPPWCRRFDFVTLVRPYPLKVLVFEMKRQTTHRHLMYRWLIPSGGVGKARFKMMFEKNKNDPEWRDRVTVADTKNPQAEVEYFGYMPPRRNLPQDWRNGIYVTRDSLTARLASHGFPNAAVTFTEITAKAAGKPAAPKPVIRDLRTRRYKKRH